MSGPRNTNSAVGSVADVLRAEIISGDLRPGDHLREIVIARRFGVTRGVAREALRLLVGEGLATHEPNRGVFVWQPDARELWELYSVRAALEGLAVRLSMLNGHAEELLVRLKTLNDRLAELGDVGTPEGRQVHVEFHEVAIELADNSRLAAMWRSVHPMAWLADLPAFIPPTVMPIHQLHLPAIEAIERGDPADASEAWVQLILSGAGLHQGLRA